MTPQLLESIGLNSTQAKCYIALIENGDMTPSELAKRLDQQRTTIHMSLQALQKLGLTEQTSNATTRRFRAANPLALERLSEKLRNQAVDIDNRVKQNLPTLLSYYHSFTERPGIRMVQGIDGFKEIYKDTLRAKQDIYLVRTIADVPALSLDYLEKYRAKRAALGITTYALTPPTKVGRHNQAEGLDQAMRFVRTWLPQDSYTAPVEIDIYGNKTAFLMFGDEIMGVIIDSSALADAMRQIFDLLRQQLALPEPQGSDHGITLSQTPA